MRNAKRLQPGLDHGEGAKGHVGVDMAHVRHPQRAIGGGVVGAGHAQTDAQGHAALSLAPAAQAGGVGRAKAGGGYGMAACRGVGHVECDARIALPPAVKGGPDGAGQKGMARPGLCQTLFMQQHIHGLTQTEQVMGRRGAIPVVPELIRVGARGPVPIGRAQIAGLAAVSRRVRKPDKAHAGRRHHALLTGGNCDIDAQIVHQERIASH